MNSSPLIRRLGKSPGRPIDKDFPQKARIALGYLLADLRDKHYLVNDSEITRELNRIGRLTSQDIGQASEKSFLNQVGLRLGKLEWHQVYLFCERVYSKLLRAVFLYEDEVIPLSEVRQYFTVEMNLILEEENLAFHFVEGLFHRRGRAQTQKALERVGTVLSDPRLKVVRNHYNKARAFFDKRPEADLENCVKESLCALEASFEILAAKAASKDFERTIKQMQGNGPRQIPAPIGEGIIKLHGYRGSAQGVAHASIQGNRVWQIDAELVLSVVAAYITYLVDLLPAAEDLPF